MKTPKLRKPSSVKPLLVLIVLIVLVAKWPGESSVAVQAVFHSLQVFAATAFGGGQ